jgi:hypothetical protein
MLHLKLNFTNPLYVSTFRDKDLVKVKILDNQIFMARKDRYLMAVNYSVDLI